MRRTMCACGRPIVVPEPDTHDAPMWAVRAHNDSPWHRRWADAVIDPPARLSADDGWSRAELRGRR